MVVISKPLKHGNIYSVCKGFVCKEAEHVVTREHQETGEILIQWTFGNMSAVTHFRDSTVQSSKQLNLLVVTNYYMHGADNSLSYTLTVQFDAVLKLIEIWYNDFCINLPYGNFCEVRMQARVVQEIVPDGNTPTQKSWTFEEFRMRIVTRRYCFFRYSNCAYSSLQRAKSKSFAPTIV